MQYLQKITDIITNDGRLTIKHITTLVGISSGTLFTILKKHLGLREISARWISHLLTEKRMRIKIYKNCNRQRLSEIVTYDETLMHCFEPQRKIDKMWMT